MMKTLQFAERILGSLTFVTVCFGVLLARNVAFPDAVILLILWTHYSTKIDQIHKSLISGTPS